MKVQNIKNDPTAKLNEARLYLDSVEKLLTSDDVASVLAESLYYNLMREIRNLIVGIGVCADIADQVKGESRTGGN